MLYSLYSNLLLKKKGLPRKRHVEFPFFTDAHLTGDLEIASSPYQLINCCTPNQFRHNKPSFVFRAKTYFEDEDIHERMQSTNDEGFHGGTYEDEMAALVSLCLGCRMKSGGRSRMFGADDKLGRPISAQSKADPVLSNSSRYPIIPNLLEMKSIEHANRIFELDQLNSDQAISLVRAARMYQEAVWICDQQPELSWLLIVSAIETVANEWSTQQDDPVNKLELFNSELKAKLHLHGGEEFMQEVAGLLVPYMGATGKFVNFIMEFLPPPPAKRPPEHFQHSWSKNKIKKSLGKVYNYRSKALHGGQPFPAPMCEPTFELIGEAYSEVISLGIGMKGFTWVAKDIPMHLHLFEYLARNSILNWWDSLLSPRAKPD